MTKMYYMRYLHNIFTKIILSAVSIFLISPVSAIAQDATSANAASTATSGTSSSGFVFDVNTALALLVIFLFFVIALLAFTLRSSMELYRNRMEEKKQYESSNTGKIIPMIIMFLFLGSISVMAQTTGATDAPAQGMFTDNRLLRYLLFFIILLELIAIWVMVRWIRFFTGIEEMRKVKGKSVGFSVVFSNWWNKVNKFKPIEKEHSLDMGHSFDGIRELDNATPPWFTVSFLATILFAVVYLWRFHAAANPAPDQYQEYENQVAEAKLVQDAYMKAQGGQVDENTVKMLGGADVEAGQKLFTANCLACHGDKGQGGVGPNLTDDYWLHGGTINNIFRTITVGVVEKGMQSWKDVFSPMQIAQLASYIKSIHGTNPPGAKEPQGDLFKEQAPAADSTTAKPDSSAVAANK